VPLHCSCSLTRQGVSKISDSKASLPFIDCLTITTHEACLVGNEDGVLLRTPEVTLLEAIQTRPPMASALGSFLFDRRAITLFEEMIFALLWAVPRD
jgi:hypothetical protein